MIKVYRIKDFDARKDHKYEFRRGFILPSKYEFRTFLFVADDKCIDHERLADAFISLSQEEIEKMVSEMGVQTQEEFEKVFKSIYNYQKQYKKVEEKYPTSRKDYLIYEEGAVAFDEKAAFNQKLVIYRDSDRFFRIDPATEKILTGYANLGWKLEAAPENVANASERFF